MSFISVFEELSSLYESEEPVTDVEEVTEEVATKGETEEKPLTEAIEDDEVVDPAETEETDEVEEPASEEVRQVVLECTNCGAVVIRAESDVKVDDESDLANVKEPCQYCEETAGYKIVGIVAPYEVEEAAEEAVEEEDAAFTDDESVEESLLDVDLPIDVDVQANGNNVSVGTLG